MRLGPITGATLVVRDLQRSLAAYGELCGLIAQQRGQLAQQRALDMGDASLAHAPCARLGGPDAVEPWLTLIEMPQAPLGAPHARRGWLALVLAVADVDALAARVDRRNWQMLGEPADRLAVTATRWMPLAGPDGEVLHLQSPTSTRDLRPAAPINRLHGVVLGAANCAVALGFYEGLGLCGRWRQQVPVAALDHTRAPVAFGQLAGGEIIEIDSVAGLPGTDSTLRTGLRLISFARSDRLGRRLVARDDPSARILAGPEGEGIELV